MQEVLELQYVQHTQATPLSERWGTAGHHSPEGPDIGIAKIPYASLSEALGDGWELLAVVSDAPRMRTYILVREYKPKKTKTTKKQGEKK